ncbi:unnamed protein product [Phytophthora fragariaefolia]|uniref:Unnamed protein product n=1 Tax=Phytophthora fragariaefolia TaxID=1490495 RepID=A0A9W6WY10_9STRA|nr:unnamed protein product [Phytophthora fragariaefolia]
MGGVKLAVVGSLLSVAAVQSVPWWGDIGAAHGVRATPLALNQVPAQFGRRDSESDTPHDFPWRALAQADGEDDGIHPKLRTLPPFNVLDEDGDDSVGLDEWKDYVKKLKAKALSIIDPAMDPMAKQCLTDIARFHYDNLELCIEDRLQSIVEDIQRNCYIKFRYSLYAGPPPFELVSNGAPTVSAHEVELWFVKQADIARHDISTAHVSNLDEDAEQRVDQLVACIQQDMEAWVRA